jgi:hypothetical protein
VAIGLLEGLQAVEVALEVVHGCIEAPIQDLAVTLILDGPALDEEGPSGS